MRDGELLRAENVCRWYDDGVVRALDGVDLTVQRGEYVALTGPSGSGKSTLLHLLGGLERPTSGDILIEGKRLSEIPNAARVRAEKIGFVFQAFLLIPTLTAIENVQMPMFESRRPRREWASRAAALLAAVNLSHRADHLPAKLSVGERQRVAIARALANDPVVLLADEPTGNLDSRNADEVLELFAQLRRERNLTLVVVTHSADVANRADRTVALRDGRVITASQTMPS
jgi:putative ABC transport system ATP-binding protein